MANPLYDALIKPHLENEAVFLVTDQGDEISFASFAQMSGRIASVLIEAGLKPGDRLVSYTPKTPETLALYVGVIQAGGVYLPLNTSYTASELDYFITDASPSVIVCSHGDLEGLTDLSKKVGAKVLTIDPDGSGTVRDMSGTARVAGVVDRSESDLAGLLYTSGTTGRSKGAMLSQMNLLSNAEVLAEHWAITERDHLIHALPIFHTHGLFVAINSCLLAGASMRFMASFDVDRIIAALPQATLMMGVPTFYTRLLGQEAFDRALVSNMRLFISGSAPLLAETHEAFERRTGHRILERYGMTETNMNTSNPYEGARKAGTVGRPLPGVEVIVAGPDGVALEQGEIGMVEVRGPNVFQGYLNMPEKTAEELRDSGFFITGDLGQFDAQGYLSIVGREKDLIITGGFNVYPKEIEDVLNDIDGVLESAVFGVPDADFGEKIVASVVLDGDVSEAVMRAAVEGDLARFKHPRVYQVMEALPRNTMGKVQKNVLKQAFVASASPA